MLHISIVYDLGKLSGIVHNFLHLGELNCLDFSFGKEEKTATYWRTVPVFCRRCF
jgi:hypothetical protein